MDDHDEVKYLPIMARLNVEVDSSAKAWTAEHGTISLDSADDLVPSNNSALIIHGAHVTSNYYNRLIETFTEMNYMTYLCRRFGWKRDVIQDQYSMEILEISN